MARTHLQIALVGSQPTPVYQGITHMMPNQVLLVCSSNTRKQANDIRASLRTYSDSNFLIYEMSDSDLAEMYKTAETIVDSLPKGITLSLNVTGGMKLWSIIFDRIFRRRKRSCHTFFIGQNGSLFDMKKQENLGKVHFDMDAQFKILGHTLDEFMPLTAYTPEDFDVLNRVMNWGVSFHYHKPLFDITSKFLNEYRATYGNLSYSRDFNVTDYRNELDWNAEEKSFVCTLKGNTQEFCSPHVDSILLNTGWFELYTARMIGKICSTDNIRLNCIFKNSKNLPKNEIDIIVNTGTKLIFVECKTQVFNTTDVDKFNSAVHNYGGLGSKALFVTYSPMKMEAKEKCNDYGITTFHFDDKSYNNTEDRIKALSAVIEKLNNTWNVK